MSKLEEFHKLKKKFASQSFLAELAEKNELEDSTTFKHAIKILARKDYSRAKLIQKLKDRECPREEIEPVIDLLIEKQWFREDFYIEGRIKYFIRKGHATHSIKSKLNEEDVSVSLQQIQHLFEELQISHDQQITDLIHKRLRPGENPERIPDRVMRYILSRGHSFQDILRLYKQYQIHA